MSVTITLRPLGASFEVPEGSPLQDHLFAYGVEFPCGGRGRCKGCRVRVAQGTLPVTAPQQQMLSAEELSAGWRLACQCSAASDLTLELAQWEAAILSDDSPLSFHPRDGYGIAIDVGTTTIVGQLLDLREGKVLAVRSALNQQARFGADIMSRVGFAVAEHGQEQLVRSIRTQTGRLVAELLAAASVPAAGIAEVVLVGNTVMHHLFCDHDLTPLSAYPFESATRVSDGTSDRRSSSVSSPASAASSAATSLPGSWPPASTNGSRSSDWWTWGPTARSSSETDTG
jgi:uncharacterized 2Fe-2S/4Fe-4S cluster protein (DUF4445 family)